MIAAAPVAGYDLATADADYPRWDGPPVRTLVICTHQRSGSTLLGEAIAFAGGLGTPLEYFHRGFRPSFAKRWGSAGLKGYVADLHRHRTDPSGTFAVKLFWQDVADLLIERDPAFEPLRAIAPGDPTSALHQRANAVLATVLPNPVWIRLERLDTVRQAVSLVRARQTDVWRDLARRDLSAIPQPHYDFEALAEQLYWIHRTRGRWEAFFTANQIVPHRIGYEQMARDLDATFERLCTLLGHNESPTPRPRTKRQADALSEAWMRRLLADLMRRDPCPS